MCFKRKLSIKQKKTNVAINQSIVEAKHNNFAPRLTFLETISSLWCLEKMSTCDSDSPVLFQIDLKVSVESGWKWLQSNCDWKNGGTNMGTAKTWHDSNITWEVSRLRGRVSGSFQESCRSNTFRRQFLFSYSHLLRFHHPSPPQPKPPSQ